MARELAGKVVASIERDGNGVKISFTDGSAVSIEPSHPSPTGGNHIYFHVSNSRMKF
jgi:hypothetical protein